MAGLQQAQKDYDSLVKENQGSITFLETQLQESQAERSRMEAHYRKECERLCKIIDAVSSAVNASRSNRRLHNCITCGLPWAIQLGVHSTKRNNPSTWVFEAYKSFVLMLVCNEAWHLTVSYVRPTL